MKKSVLFLLLITVSFSYAKKFLIKKGDIIDGALNVGIVLPQKQKTKYPNPYNPTQKEPPQVYPISITLISDQFKNCNALGQLIFNPDFDRFYGNISKISCDENGKIKDYSTKGYILNSRNNIGLGKGEVMQGVSVKIMIVKDIK